MKMNRQMDNKELILSTTDEFEAYLVQGALEVEGIEVVLLNKKDSSYTHLGEIELYVKLVDVEKAKAIIETTRS
jgi:hypothetical protein